MATNVPEDEWRRQTHCFVVLLWKSLSQGFWQQNSVLNCCKYWQTVAFNTKYSFKGKDSVYVILTYIFESKLLRKIARSQLFVCV